MLHAAAHLARGDLRFDAALRLLDRALPLDPRPREVLTTRVGILSHWFHSTHEDAAFTELVAELDAIFASAERGSDMGDLPRTLAVTVAVALATKSRWSESLSCLDRALALTADVDSAELSLYRVVWLGRAAPRERDRLTRALEDLARRAEARQAELERRGQLDVVARTALEALREEVRLAAQLEVGRRPMALANALDEHPGRRYLDPDYAP